MSAIESYLKSCRELSRFCSRSGWIDNDSLHYTITWENDLEALVDIEFEELLMEDAGNLVRKISCFGQMRMFLDAHGRVVRAEII